METFISQSFSIFKTLQNNSVKKFGVNNGDEEDAIVQCADRARQILHRLATAQKLCTVFEKGTTVRPGVDFSKLSERHHLKLDKLIDQLEEEEKATMAATPSTAASSMSSAGPSHLTPSRRRHDGIVPNKNGDNSNYHYDIGIRDKNRKRAQRRDARAAARDKCQQTAVEDPLPISLSLLRTKLYHIVTIEQLARLSTTLCTVREFAFDFELTCFRNAGHPRDQRVCLLQISTDSIDFLVDVLVAEVRVNIAQMLGNAFADECIEKVCHGPQERAFLRQIDIHSVKHLVDTSEGGRRNLRSLVFEACGVWLNKSMQTADWTLRPLTKRMVDYARSDTHYLIRCYHYLKKAGKGLCRSGR